jgi:diguanylate cyclase (GGDEF)-like protein
MSVLIVDDSPPTRASLQSLLEKQGHESVWTAGSGGEALALLTRPDAPPVDVIVMDVDMPGLSGIETCRRVKAERRLRDIPVVIVTGDTAEETLQTAFAAGACDYLVKPASPPELLARLRSALALKHELDRRKARERELRRLNRTLRRLAVIDALTGLGNRRCFNLLLKQEWGRAAREAAPLALLLIDVDQFKGYNDHYGHVKGDECLRRVARRLRGLARRPGDHALRYGGEEFAVLLPNTGSLGAAHMAEAVRRGVEDLGLEHAAAVAGRVTVSVGAAAVVPERGSAPGPLTAAADAALYAAKRAGRNRVHVAGEAAGDAIPLDGSPVARPPSAAPERGGPR